MKVMIFFSGGDVYLTMVDSDDQLDAADLARREATREGYRGNVLRFKCYE